MAEGSVNLKVQAENRLALDSLWRMYKNGTLKARLEALFVTDEMRELAGGEGVEVIVTIDEREYENARDELTTEARGNVTMLCHHWRRLLTHKSQKSERDLGRKVLFSYSPGAALLLLQCNNSGMYSMVI